MTTSALPRHFAPPQPSSFSPHWARYRKWSINLYRKHSDLITGLGMFALNTAILASKIFKTIPPSIHRGCYTALSFSGMIWMNIRVRDLMKCGSDLSCSIQARDAEAIVCCAAKVAVKALDILLTCSLMAAALLSLFAHPQIAIALYAAMRPFSLFSLAMGILNEIYDYKKNSTLCGRVTVISQNPKKMEKVTWHFLDQLHGKKKTPESDEKKLARHLFKQLDHYVLEAIREERQGQETGSALLQELKAKLQQKNQYIQAHMGLTAAGYLSMGICRAWPDSLIQSSVTWVMSLLYTSKMVWQKSHQLASTPSRDAAHPQR